jgi:hypothetical protein
MIKISSLKELNEEKQRITQRINDLETLIEADMDVIRKDLSVWRVAGNTVKSFLITEENGMMGESVGIAVDTVIKKLLFRRSNWIVKFMLSFLIKNFARNYLSKNAENIFEKIKNMVSNHHRKEEPADY